jgi:RNA polymerase sigma-70 factor (ECF subfamily)
LVERQLPKLNVAGSNPVSRSNDFWRRGRAVRQRSAKPRSPVQLRTSPPHFLSGIPLSRFPTQTRVHMRRMRRSARPALIPRGRAHTVMCPAAMSEEDCVRRIQAGDDDAFDRLVALCGPRVYSLTLRLLGNADDAADVAQEVFVRVFSALPRFKWDAAFSTWLYRIAVNACYDELKRRRRRPLTLTECSDAETEPLVIEHMLVSSQPGTEDLLVQQERQAVITHAIRSLPDPFRAVLVLYDVQGLSYQEIAEVLGQNLGTIKSRLNRARNLLREKLSTNRELFSTLVSRTQR